MNTNYNDDVTLWTNAREHYAMAGAKLDIFKGHVVVNSGGTVARFSNSNDAEQCLRDAGYVKHESGYWLAEPLNKGTAMKTKPAPVEQAPLHNPLPWKCPAADNKSECGLNIRSVDGITIASTGNSSATRIAEARANATLIVEAVNSHAALNARNAMLVEALERIHNNEVHLNYSCINEINHTPTCSKCIARAALQAAKEGKPVCH